MVAAGFRSPEVVSLLINASGNDKEINESLLIAAGSNSSEVVSLLLKAGAIVTHRVWSSAGSNARIKGTDFYWELNDIYHGSR